jgi:hypothetical protein
MLTVGGGGRACGNLTGSVEVAEGKVRIMGSKLRLLETLAGKGTAAVAGSSLTCVAHVSILFTCQ